MSKDPQDTMLDRWRRKRWEKLNKPVDKSAKVFDIAEKGIHKGIGKIQSAVKKQKKENTLSPVLIEIAEHLLTSPPGYYSKEVAEELKGKERIIYKAGMEHQKQIREQFHKDLEAAWQRYINEWRHIDERPKRKRR